MIDLASFELPPNGNSGPQLSEKTFEQSRYETTIPPGTRWQCTAKTFYYGVFGAYRLKLT